MHDHASLHRKIAALTLLALLIAVPASAVSRDRVKDAVDEFSWCSRFARETADKVAEPAVDYVEDAWEYAGDTARDVKDDTYETYETVKCRAIHTLSVRGPIHIDGDRGEPDCAEVEGDCTDPENGIRKGDGSKSDPYVIRDWRIVSPLGSRQPGIEIENTQAHFKIFQNHITTEKGIVLRDAPNVRVVSNVLETTELGVEVRATTAPGQKGNLDSPQRSRLADGPIIKDNTVHVESGNGMRLVNVGGDDGQIWIWNNQIRIDGRLNAIRGTGWDFEVHRNEIEMTDGSANGIDLKYIESKSHVNENAISYIGSARVGPGTTALRVVDGDVHTIRGNDIEGSLDLSGGHLYLPDNEIRGQVSAHYPDRLCVCSGTTVETPFAGTAVYVYKGREADVLGADVESPDSDQGVLMFVGTSEVHVDRSTVRCGRRTSDGIHADNVDSLTVRNNDFIGCSNEVVTS